MATERRCVICNRPRDHWLHGPPLGGIANETAIPRLEQHDFDPGERRGAVRRQADQEGPARPDRRRLVRRMDDRVALIERVVEEAP